MFTTPELQLVECPRDAMQGIHPFIPTEKKIDYLNALLRVGFDTLDFGSFVSPKAIPQMRDTHEVIKALDVSQTKTKLLAIVANLRGGEEAFSYSQIDAVGFPFSISETFQLRNTNKTIAESFEHVKQLQALATAKNRELIIYISMGFGNPYGEAWNAEIVEEWTDKMAAIGIKTISLSDTIGTSNPESISYIFKNLIPRYPEVVFGAHLHTTARTWREKIDAAYNAGCRRFDGAIKGYGGCPLAQDALCGNMPTENLLSFAADKKLHTGINTLAFESAYNQAIRTFPQE
jgi:hydroxymethylglutaryl-CoA lyase